MSSYATIADIAKMMHTTEDQLTQQQKDEISSLLEQTKAEMDSQIGDLTKGIRSEYVCFSCGCSCGQSVLLHTINVIKITKINKIDYEGIAGIDYIIENPNKRKVTFYTPIDSYLSSSFCGGKTLIEYESGFDPVPKDLVLAQSLMTVGYFMLDASGNVIDKYKMGPRAVEYDTSATPKIIKSIMDRYRTFNLSRSC